MPKDHPLAQLQVAPIPTVMPRMNEWVEFPAHDRMRLHIFAFQLSIEQQRDVYYICLFHLAGKKCRVRNIVHVMIAVLRECENLFPQRCLPVDLATAYMLVNHLVHDPLISRDIQVQFIRTTEIPKTLSPRDHLFA